MVLQISQLRISEPLDVQVAAISVPQLPHLWSALGIGVSIVTPQLEQT